MAKRKRQAQKKRSKGKESAESIEQEVGRNNDIPLDIAPEPSLDAKQSETAKKGHSVVENGDLQQRIEAAKSQVNAAMENAIAAAQDDGDIGANCDAYAAAAKRFAKLILEERKRLTHRDSKE